MAVNGRRGAPIFKPSLKPEVYTPSIIFAMLSGVFWWKVSFVMILSRPSEAQKKGRNLSFELPGTMNARYRTHAASSSSSSYMLQVSKVRAIDIRYLQWP